MLLPLTNNERLYHEAAIVCDDDPEGLLRVRVRVFGMMDDIPDADLPWADYLLPVGARTNSGYFQPCHIGDYVWVHFPHQTHGEIDTRRPLIVGSIHHNPDYKPNLPHEAWDGEKRIEHKRTGNEPVPDIAEYHESRVDSQHGIVIETERPGVYRITHRATGTAFEISEQGHTVLHSENSAFFSSRESTEVESGGSLVINVLSGNAEINVDGDAMVNAGKGVSLEAGSDIDLKASGSINIDAGGGINNVSGAPFTVKAPRFVETLG
ncbi:phage baseplate assembly protein V [Endozoicomonas lisbonensis]|uniref:Gp5/Type VI secretion system Vgr protein OB-fold domain-containing protein n=1 Tax=Endozoicomonas lisbonensis TaxID=3120522 RepID=A0ABV2SQG8_9GAMM